MLNLVDVNVLVALMHARHQHSESAVQWLEDQDEAGSVVLCRVTQMGALRVLTNAKWMKSEVLSAREFWKGWDRLVGDERFLFADEPPSLDDEWRKMTSGYRKGKMAETDSYLAAFAMAGGCCMVTFDRGFREFRRLETSLLK